jgi:hypothetical protein
LSQPLAFGCLHFVFVLEFGTLDHRPRLVEFAFIAARTGGATWTAALQAAGLNIPTDSDLTAHQQALRSELYGLWDCVPTMTEWVRRNTLSSVAYRDLTLLLRQLLI